MTVTEISVETCVIDLKTCLNYILSLESFVDFVSVCELVADVRGHFCLNMTHAQCPKVLR